MLYSRTMLYTPQSYKPVTFSLGCALALALISATLILTPSKAIAEGLSKVKQTGAFEKWENALSLSEELMKAGKKAYIMEKTIKGKVYYAVLEGDSKIETGKPGKTATPSTEKDMGYKQVGAFLNRQNAENMIISLRQHGAVTFHCMKKETDKVYYKVYKKTGVVVSSPCTTIIAEASEPPATAPAPATTPSAPMEDQSAPMEIVPEGAAATPAPATVPSAPMEDQSAPMAIVPEGATTPTAETTDTQSPLPTEQKEAEAVLPPEETESSLALQEQDDLVKQDAGPDTGVANETMDAQGQDVAPMDTTAMPADGTAVAGAAAVTTISEGISTDIASETDLTIKEKKATETETTAEEEKALMEQQDVALADEIQPHQEQDMATDMSLSLMEDGTPREHPPLIPPPPNFVLDSSTTRNIDDEIHFYIKPEAIVYKERNQFGTWYGRFKEFGGGTVMNQSNKWYAIRLQGGVKGYIQKSDTVEYTIPYDENHVHDQ